MPRTPAVLILLGWKVAVCAIAVTAWGGPGFGPPPAAAQETGSRHFAAHVLALRAGGVAGVPEATDFLATIPGSGMVPRAALPGLWGPTFANAMVVLGRLGTAGPVALFYDPLLDVAIVTRWAEQGTRYVVVQARALPGARLGDPAAVVDLLPSWMTAAGDPGETLALTAAARVEAFRRLHPANATEPGRSTTTFAADAADLRDVLPRLTWNALRREQWSERSQAWLKPVVADIEAALGAGDAAGLLAGAPDTDFQTAAALADLPRGFADSLVLDMWLEVGDTSRLLIGSLPEDGDLYVFVLCRWGAATCGIRRFMLLSLAE